MLTGNTSSSSSQELIYQDNEFGQCFVVSICVSLCLYKLKCNCLLLVELYFQNMLQIANLDCTQMSNACGACWFSGQSSRIPTRNTHLTGSGTCCADHFSERNFLGRWIQSQFSGQLGLSSFRGSINWEPALAGVMTGNVCLCHLAVKTVWSYWGAFPRMRWLYHELLYTS
jgi:hypothetical protein